MCGCDCYLYEQENECEKCGENFAHYCNECYDNKEDCKQQIAKQIIEILPKIYEKWIIIGSAESFVSMFTRVIKKEFGVEDGD